MIEIIIVFIVVSIAGIYIFLKYKRKIGAIIKNDNAGVCKSCPYIKECSKVNKTSNEDIKNLPPDCKL